MLQKAHGYCVVCLNSYGTDTVRAAKKAALKTQLADAFDGISQLVWAASLTASDYFGNVFQCRSKSRSASGLLTGAVSPA
jgi:hypothetical protein